jgi:SulP family sulfate permease
MSPTAELRASGWSWNVLRGDLFGGIAAGVVALPLALAFGVASGLGPAAGLYGAIAIGIVAALLGGTPVQISGPTGPITLVVAGMVAAHTLPSGAVELPWLVGVFVLAGLFQIVLGVCRLGVYIRYVPYPVISGFMSGIGVIILVQQLFPFLGMAPPASDPWSILRHLHLVRGNVNWSAIALSAATVAMVYLVPRLTKVVPASLVTLVVLTGVAALLKLDVPRIGEIPSGLPGLVLPTFDLRQLPAMLPLALELALLGAIDSLLTSLVADNLTRTRHDSNRELFGQGVGNMVKPGCSAAFPAGGHHAHRGQRECRRKDPPLGRDPRPFPCRVLLGLSGTRSVHSQRQVLAGPAGDGRDRILDCAGLAISPSVEPMRS